jgi:hypothetical protein
MTGLFGVAGLGLISKLKTSLKSIEISQIFITLYPLFPAGANRVMSFSLFVRCPDLSFLVTFLQIGNGAIASGPCLAERPISTSYSLDLDRLTINHGAVSESNFLDRNLVLSQF